MNKLKQRLFWPLLAGIVLYIFSVSLLLLGLHSLLHTKPISLQTNTVESPSEIQRHIASQVIRLHVIANSDSPEDQELKLSVRNHIIGSLRTSIHQSDSILEARQKLQKSLPLIQSICQETIRQAGYNYSVKVCLCRQTFPKKTYGDMTFPSGNYEALCVKIGSAKGHNWWCVLWPSLCFVNETTAVVPNSSKSKLKRCLTEEEYAALLENKAYLQIQNRKEKTPVEYHSALYDLMHH